MRPLEGIGNGTPRRMAIDEEGAIRLGTESGLRAALTNERHQTNASLAGGFLMENKYLGR